jgi:hypothetical protein
VGRARLLPADCGAAGPVRGSCSASTWATVREVATNVEPFNPVSGYTIIAAESLDGAIELAKGCPILEGGGSIEICETFSMM